MLKVVIVGSGFAGLRVARNLRKHGKKIHVTLITDSLTFRYSPALYRSATGHRRRESIIPIRYITQSYRNVTIVHGKVVGINRAERVIITEDKRVHNYDIAVLATGVVTSYFGIPGLEEHSFGIKSAEALEELKNHLHQTLITTSNPDRNYVVVGGGATGVELSAALAKYLRKITKRHKTKHKAIKLELVEAAPRLLPQMQEKASKKVAKRLRKLGVKIMVGEVVKAETATTLKLADRTLPTKTVIWTAGVTNNPFYKQNADQFNLNERGKVIVDDFLQVDERTFVIGDNAATKYGGLALVAIWDANYVSRQIVRSSKGKAVKPYKQKKPISIVPAGETWSVLQWNTIVLTGRFPSLLRSMADFIGYADIMGIRKAFSIWRRYTESEESCAICHTPLS